MTDLDPNSAAVRSAKRIPIAAAKRIAKDFGQRQVIILSWANDRQLYHVVTYGTTLVDCEQAAQGGNKMKRALGWPEDLCKDKPSRVKAKENKPDDTPYIPKPGEYVYEAMKVMAECMLEATGKLDVGLLFATGIEAMKSKNL